MAPRRLSYATEVLGAVVAITGLGMAGMVVVEAIRPVCWEAVLPPGGGDCSKSATVDIQNVNGADRIVCRCEATAEVGP